MTPASDTYPTARQTRLDREAAYADRCTRHSDALLARIEVVCVDQLRTSIMEADERREVQWELRIVRAEQAQRAALRRAAL